MGPPYNDNHDYNYSQIRCGKETAKEESMETSRVCSETTIERGKVKNCGYSKTQEKEPWTKDEPPDQDSTKVNQKRP